MAEFNVNSIMHKYKICYFDSVEDLDGKLAKCTYTFIIEVFLCLLGSFSTELF